jgi:hypothetical protein
VIVTDGGVQSVTEAQLQRLRVERPSVRVALLDGGDERFCAAPAWPVSRIPPLDKHP